MKKIALLGATGSIGIQTLDVIRNHPDEFQLIGFSAGKNIEKTIEIINEFKVRYVSVINEEDAFIIQEQTSVSCFFGNEGLIQIATLEEANILVNAVMGRVGLEPTLRAIQCGKDIALANKETLVTAGHIVMKEAKKYNVNILPVDSEHSAIFQCLNGENPNGIDHLIITASGGSFRNKTREELEHVTVEDALNHPNWSMGAKITIDSATMMNKGLEVIEAHHLFDIDYDHIEVVQHQESVIHSMVQMKDGSILAHLGTPDMRIPIQYALTHPNRFPLEGKRINFGQLKQLNFKEMDLVRFPCLAYAIHAGRVGGSLPTVLNAANEVAVELFLNKQIKFLTIERIIKDAMDEHEVVLNPTLEDILRIDAEVRTTIKGKVNNYVS